LQRILSKKAVAVQLNFFWTEGFTFCFEVERERVFASVSVPVCVCVYVSHFVKGVLRERVNVFLNVWMCVCVCEKKYIDWIDNNSAVLIRSFSVIFLGNKIQRQQRQRQRQQRQRQRQQRQRQRQQWFHLKIIEGIFYTTTTATKYTATTTRTATTKYTNTTTTTRANKYINTTLKTATTKYIDIFNTNITITLQQQQQQPQQEAIQIFFSNLSRYFTQPHNFSAFSRQVILFIHFKLLRIYFFSNEKGKKGHNAVAKKYIYILKNFNFHDTF